MRHLIIFLILALLVSASSAHAGCDETAKAVDAAHDRSWIKSDKIIVYEHNDKIYRTAFNSNNATLIASPPSGYLGHGFELSAQGHYAFYEGSTSKDDYSAYVYDLMAGKEHKLDLPPRVSISKTAFSPDGRKFAWLENNAIDLVILDLSSISYTRVTLPEDVKKLEDYRGSRIYWSLNSQILYIGVIAYSTKDSFRYDLPTGKIVKILGQHSSDKGFHFIDAGKTVSFYKQPCLQSNCTGPQGSAAKGVSVSIDQDDQLVLKTPDKKLTVVDKGDWTSCEGLTIRPLSWLENGKYLVYELDSVTYIYGVKERRKAILFDLNAAFRFGWGDTQNRASAVNQ